MAFGSKKNRSSKKSNTVVKAKARQQSLDEL
jgi:hypothetical protein